MITKEKRKKKRLRDWTQTISHTPLAIQISTSQEIILTFPHPPLWSHDGYCLAVDVNLSSTLL